MTFFKTRNVPLGILFLAAIYVAAYFLSYTTVEVPTGSHTRWTLSEIVIVLFTGMLLVATSSPLRDWEMNRRRARFLTTAIWLLELIALVGAAWLARCRINIAYSRAAPDAQTFPESELELNNIVLMFALLTICIAMFGRTYGFVIALLAYAALVVCAGFIPPDAYYPLGIFQGPGPWWKPWTIASTSTATLLAGWYYFRQNGISSRAAVSHREVGQ